MESAPDVKTVQSNYQLRVNKSIENWTKQALNNFITVFSKVKFSNQYDETKLQSAINFLWELFSGVQKVHDRPLQIEGAAKNDRLITEVFMNDRTSVRQLESVVKEIVKLHERNIQKIVQNPKYFCYMVRTLGRFETTYKNLEFWNLVARVTRELIAIGVQTQKPTNNEHIFALIKRLSEFKYYYTHLAMKVTDFSTRETLKNLNELQAKAISHLVKGPKTASYLNSMVSVLYLFQNQKDDLRKDIISELHSYLKQANNIHDLALSINKLQKLKTDPACQKLFEFAKARVLPHLNSKDLSFADFSLIFKAMLDTTEFKRGHFERLWETFKTVVESQDPRNLQLSEQMNILFSVVRHPSSSDDKIQFMQTCILIALQNVFNKVEPVIRSSMKDRDEQDEDDESVRKETQNSREEIKNFLLLILNSLTYRKENFTLNPTLIQIIYTYFADNIEQIAGRDYISFVYYSAEIFSKLRKDSLPEGFLEDLHIKADKLHDQFKVDLISNLSPLSDLVLLRTFQSYCALNLVNEEIYQILETEITQRIFKGLDCLRVLKGLVDLKEIAGTELGFDTAPFEELLTRRFLLALPTSHISEYTIYPHVLKELAPLPSYKFILQGFQNYLCNNFKKLGIEKICFIMYTCSKQNLSDKFLEQAIPFFSEELAKRKVQLEVIRRIINIYINNIAGNTEFFALLESKVLQEAKAYSQLETPVDRKQTTLDFVNIFFELTKFNVQNPELLPFFEKIFKRDNLHYNFDELTACLTGLGTYLSENIPLMKELLQRFNEKFSTQKEQRSFTETPHRPTLQNFQHAIATIELEYKGRINLENYPNVLAVSKILMENIEKIRDKKVENSKFQNNLTKQLELLQYSIEVEQPIGIYLADILIKPNIVIEIAGVSHYQRGTTQSVWRFMKKIRQLQKLGYKVVTIPYFEWEKFEHTHLRTEYLKQKIEEAV